MKKTKLFFWAVLSLTVFVANGQFSEKWKIDYTGYVEYYFIGCENMDNDANSEIIYWDFQSEDFLIIDGATGKIDFKLSCYDVSHDSEIIPLLVDVNKDGKFELLFYGRILQNESEGIHLYAFDNATKSQDIEANKININNYPNPFDKATTIKYNVNGAGLVVIKLYDVNGTELKTLLNEKKDSGEYELNFESDDLKSGTYFYQVQMGSVKDAKKMLIIK